MASKRVPSPAPTVPGAVANPKKTPTRAKQLGADVQAITDVTPYLTEMINAQILPAEQRQLEAAQQVSPEYQKLITDLYRQYGPQLSDIGNKITEQNQLANQASINKVLAGPGKDTVAQTLALQQSVDQPFFDARALGLTGLQDMLGAIDLSGGLSPTERDEIARGLARENLQAGTYNAPSQLDTVANAMRYGEAGYARKQQSLSNLSAALQQVSSFLPNSKSGIDAFGTATSQSKQENPGQSMFLGIRETGNNTDNQYGLANSLLGGMNQKSMQSAQIDAGKKDWLDKVVQGTQSFSNFSGGLTSMIGACWVAREVYGESNPRWLQYREWLLSEAPSWFRNLYIKFGERFARWIHNKPMLKYLIKKWMDSVIN